MKRTTSVKKAVHPKPVVKKRAQHPKGVKMQVHTSDAVKAADAPVKQPKPIEHDPVPSPIEPTPPADPHIGMEHEIVRS